MTRLLLLLLLLSLITSCTKSAGIENSSETTNGFVATAVDADGNPIAGATVSIWEADSREREPLTTTTTKSDGSFVIAAEQLGTYRLQVVKEGIGYSSVIEKSRELLTVKQVSLFELSTMQLSNSDDVPLQFFLLGAGIDTIIQPGSSVNLQLPVSEQYESAVNNGDIEQYLTFDLRLYDTGSVTVTDISQDLTFQGADGYLLDSLIMVDFLTRHGIPMTKWSEVVTIKSGRIRELTLDGLVTNIGPSVSNLQNLWRLLLSNNKGITLADEISKLDKLNELNLSGCELREIPGQVQDIDGLSTLNVANNKLSTLPNWLSSSSSIGMICLENNAFTELPSELLSMTQLKYVNLSNNYVKTVSGIEALTSLETIIVENCSLSTLTPLYGISSLTKVKAPTNQISTLDGVSALANLKELWLGQNSLDDLPEELFTLNSCTFLQLTSNKLTSLSASIGNMTALTKLQLESNDLVTLPDEITNLTNLTEIYVGYNKLGTQTPSVTTFLNTYAESDWATNQK